MANWRLLSTIMVGVLVAVALLSSAPLYSNAINDMGLEHTLSSGQIEMLDLHVYSPDYFVNYDNLDTAEALLNNQVSRNIRSVVRQEERWLKSEDFYAGWADQPIPTGPYSPKGHFHTFTNLEEHITIVEGRYATPPGLDYDELNDPDFAIEGMIGSETAELFEVGVGDRLVFITGYGDDVTLINIELTAIIDPINPEEEYWMLYTDIFTVPPDNGKVAPIFIPAQTLFEVVASIAPDIRATYHWFYFIDSDKINAENANTIKNAVKRMERQLIANLPRSGLLTTLDKVITEYQGKLMFTQIPLFLIVAQIVAIILYYLVTVANMLIDRQAGEIALLRSRGASTRQIVGIYFMEGLLISVIGAAVGPFLGAFVFSLLGKTGSFSSLTGGELLSIRFSGAVFLLAAMGAVLCLLALLVPAIQAARRSVVYQRQQAARPPWKPVWQRFYLDIILLVFGVVLYWELRERGSLLTVDIFGGLGIDPLLLVTPILLLTAVAIVFLRLFPIIINLATRLSRYVGNAPTVLGLWYIARNPVHYGRLILLLIMATSVGMFSATFLGTLERSYDERVMYTAGSDVRLEGLNDRYVSKGTLEERYSGVPGIEELSLAYRTNGRVGTMFFDTRFELLAVDPENFSQVAWYRDGFSDKPLSELMSLLAEDAPIKEGLELPDGTEAVGMWVYPEEGNLNAEISARIKDGLGRYIDYDLGTTSAAEWQYLEIQLAVGEGEPPPPSPMSLVCIEVMAGARTGDWGNPQGIYFDDLQVRGSFSPESVIVVEDFDNVEEWIVPAYEASGSFSIEGSTTTRFTTNTEVVYNGNTSAQLTWLRGRTSSNKAVFVNIDERPLTVIASRSFLDRADVSVGQIVQIRLPGQFIITTIVDATDYFPTLDPEENAFLIANLDRLSAIRTLSLATLAYPSEVWLKLNDDTETRAATVDVIKSGIYGARELYDKEAMITSLRTDPLAGAGWGGVLMIAFLGVILVSSLGFVVYSYLSAQRRQLDFAILRTQGFSLRQIIGLVCFEQLFIIIVGMGLGTIIGERLSYIMMPFLQVTEMGERVLPPFVLTINWGTIGIAYIIMAAAFIVTISLVILFFSRVAIHRTLRIVDM
ncbi:FtsX-like permease family protein [Chloroflexota bacterium]